MRERIAFGILVGVMIVLFALTFAVLGRGEYEPGGLEGGTSQTQEPAALVATASYQ